MANADEINEINEIIERLVDFDNSETFIGNSIPLKERETFKEIGSIWSIFNAPNYDFIEESNYFICSGYISPKDEDYSLFIEDNPTYINKPFIFSREMLILGLSAMTTHCLFFTERKVIEKKEEKEISKKYNLDELFSNNLEFRNHFFSQEQNISEQDMKDFVLKTQLEGYLSENPIENTIAKLINLFTDRLKEYYNGNRPIKFLYLLSLYLNQNPNQLENFTDCKEKFTELIVNFIYSNKNNYGVIVGFDYLKKYIEFNFTNKELFSLLHYVKSSKELLEKNKNMFLLYLEGEELNLVFEKNIKIKKRRTRWILEKS